MEIAVLGSLNMDLVTNVPTLPKIGETVAGSSFENTPGGKGANQAVAAKRLGASVSMIGQVGDDIYGMELLNYLRTEGISVENVSISHSTHTGVALIGVEDSGLNSIIAVYGANMDESAAYEESIRQAVVGADVLLLQNEIPYRYNVIAAEMARKNNSVVIWDPAPVRGDAVDLAHIATFITPNEHEIVPFIDESEVIVDDIQSVFDISLRINETFSASPIITLGEKGVVFVDEGVPLLQRARSVVSVDSVAAGDAFSGALAVGIGEGMTLPEAVRFACVAGSICVQRRGAQVSMPTREEVDSLLLGF